MSQGNTQAGVRNFSNGGGVAAVLAAGIGSFALAVISLVADKSASLKAMMNFYKPTGPLSGVTTCALAIWLVVWVILHRRWRDDMVAARPLCAAGVTLLILAVLLTFPPIADLF